MRCPKCQCKLPGVYITGERTTTARYMYYACKNVSCLNVWAVQLDKERESE
jgi:hypothetical protein